MNITEATAVNVVIDRLVDLRVMRGVTHTSCPEVVTAAALLADKANKALGAGLTGDKVREALS